MKPRWNRISTVCAVTASAALISQTAMGAGFILQEQSISGLGVGFASGAAGMGDNSSMFFNPATLSLVKNQQVTFGVHSIMPGASFHNTGTLSAFDGTSGVPTQGPDAKSDKSALVPNLYASIPLSDQVVLGAAVTVPYGLATSYENGWVGRYVALETDLQTVNANIAVAYKVSDQITFGAGLNGLKAKATLSNAVDFGTLFLKSLGSVIPVNAVTQALAQDITANLGTTKYDGSLWLKGNDYGFGYNVGALITPNDSTRIGLHFRSGIALAIDGTADFETGALSTFFAAKFADQGGSVNITLPATAQASVHQQINNRWAVMADVTWTQWSKFNELNIHFSDGVLPNTVIAEKWEDVYRYSLGTTVELTDVLQLRLGVVFDESPVPSATYRSPRIPDEDRLWFTVGLGWQVSETFCVDIAYVHITVDDPVIDNPVHTSGTYLKGTMDASVNIFSLGGCFNF